MSSKIKPDNNSAQRRRFVKLGVAGVIGMPLLMLGRNAAASELPRVEESDATAKALGYVHDANTVAADVRGGAERICRSCRFYAEADAEWGPCGLFPGRSVAAKGWCKGWVPRS